MLPGVCLLSLWITTAGAPAHHAPEEIIKILSERIAGGESTAKIYYQRAIEFRILGKSGEARADLLKSLELDPALTAARHELVRVAMAGKQETAALEAAKEAVRRSAGDFERASSYMLESEVHLARNDHEAALAACDSAFTSYPGATEVDWFLLRSEIHYRANKPKERVDALKSGYDKTKSYVLKTHWIEALIDNGETDRALAEIQPEIESSRWKSAWRLREGKAYLRKGESAKATECLRESLREMNSRMRRRPPNALLMIDHGTVNALLGNLEDAKKDLELARKLRAGSWMLQRLESVISEAENEKKTTTGRNKSLSPETRAD